MSAEENRALLAPTQALVEAAAEHTAVFARMEQYKLCADQLADSEDDAILAWLSGKIMRHEALVARAAEAQQRAQVAHDAILAVLRGEA